MESLIIRHVVENNDKAFLKRTGFNNVAIYYQDLASKIYVFSYKYQENMLIDIISSDILNIYDRVLLKDILSTKLICNPDKALHNLYYLNGLLFINERISNIINHYEYSDESCFGSTLKNIIKDFDEKF